jgi:hypothetical protein
VALCLSFLPSKISDSCEWLVTRYGKVNLSQIILLILCKSFYLEHFYFIRFSKVFFEHFRVRLDSSILRHLCLVFFEGIMARYIVHLCA